MARFARGVLFLTAWAVAFAGLLGGSAYAQTFDPQPYIVYEVPAEPLPQILLVDLQDQFIHQQNVEVSERWYLMNPVDKFPLTPPGDPERRTDPALHYRWYTILVDDPGINYSVKVSNQFGEMVPWTIAGAPRFLLAPASKELFPGQPEDPPDTGHHYNCYEVVDAPPAGALVGLEDQFGPHPSADVALARYLCVPTAKTHGPDSFPMLQATDGRDHLACYDIPPHPHSEIVNTRSQFTDVEPDQTQVVEDRLLCVPSKKTREFDPQPYIVYEVPPEPLVPGPVLVDLEDQFITEQNVPVLERWYLMNPVAKTPVSPDGQTEPITDPALHYRWHTIGIDDPGIVRTVKVLNQFGAKVWTITAAPRFLLAPASKLDGGGEPGPQPAGNHYDCYEAVDADPAGAVVGLNDQFGAHGLGPLEVANARYLCAPVVKRKDGVAYQIFEAPRGRDHLACYEIPPEQHTQQVTTRTQFTGVDPDVILFEDDKLLCVPSRKMFPLVPSLAPWGIAALGVLMVLTLSWVVRRRMRYGETS